jgi:hypothetical protein
VSQIRRETADDPESSIILSFMIRENLKYDKSLHASTIINDLYMHAKSEFKWCLFTDMKNIHSWGTSFLGGVRTKSGSIGRYRSNSIQTQNPSHGVESLKHLEQRPRT